eukprot:5340500-Prymnesium_polylepis.1
MLAAGALTARRCRAVGAERATSRSAPNRCRSGTARRGSRRSVVSMRSSRATRAACRIEPEVARGRLA